MFVFFCFFFSFFFFFGNIFSYFYICLFFCVFLFFLGFLNVKGSVVDFSFGKNLIYECGYTEINSFLNFYTMQFFMIALSFMLFDMEIILVLPALYMLDFSVLSGVVVVFFLVFLLLGLLYELSCSVFKW
uniref:NADH-ubiquinone oxidoreductase chain 3 n=1 Tax=Rhopalaea idoneta TaxID=1712670 RepID=A0A173QSZ4_9ASCI|nr:NADH dehydrogenase subunit 3 [Rhopalaea idoneta]